MSNIVLIKLSTGEELVSYSNLSNTEIVELIKDNATNDLIELDKPRQLVMGQDPSSGGFVIQSFPYMQGHTDGTVAIRVTDIKAVSTGQLPQDLETSYIEQTSNITLPPKGTILS